MPAEDKKVEEVPPEEVVNEGEQKKEEKVEEVVEVEMALDEFYPEGHQEKKFADSDLSKRTVQFLVVTDKLHTKDITSTGLETTNSFSLLETRTRSSTLQLESDKSSTAETLTELAQFACTHRRNTLPLVRKGHGQTFTSTSTPA